MEQQDQGDGDRLKGEAVVDLAGLDALLRQLSADGATVLGPVAGDAAITLGEIAGVDDLPRGCRDVQGPGTYRLERTDAPELFGWAVGPQSPKASFFPPRSTEWRARLVDGMPVLDPEPAPATGPDVLFGLRPCELSALRVLDTALGGGPVPDTGYRRRRAGAVVVVVECAAPAGTCFCASMGTGPGVPDDADADVMGAHSARDTDDGRGEPDYDLALTELSDEVGHRFLVRAATARGAALLASVPTRPVGDEDRVARRRLLDRSRASMGRVLDTEDLPGLLARNIEHPRWDDVADRCLACGNCTLVCPTCFCSTVEDVSGLDGTVERQRSWASCFDLAHSFVHGGPVRQSNKARYRQWLTHKLSTWWDQFGTSGCVGCGRCITWCPVGIDLTEEAAAIRRTDGAARGGEPAIPMATSMGAAATGEG